MAGAIAALADDSAPGVRLVADCDNEQLAALEGVLRRHQSLLFGGDFSPDASDWEDEVSRWSWVRDAAELDMWIGHAQCFDANVAKALAGAGLTPEQLTDLHCPHNEYTGPCVVEPLGYLAATGTMTVDDVVRAVMEAEAA